jgi:hypothetical protein
MRILTLPKTLLGWWSVGLCVASIILFALFVVILGPGPDYNMALAYALTAVVAGIAAAAFITGLISATRNKERSIFVFIAMVIGLYSLIAGILALLGLAK